MQEFSSIRQKLIEKAKAEIRRTFTKDLLLIEAGNAISELDELINIAGSRLKSVAVNFFPEIEDMPNDAAAVLVLEKTQKEFQNAVQARLSAEDVAAVRAIAGNIQGNNETRKKLQKYMESLAKEICPNLSKIIEPSLAAKLISTAGSLRKLAMMPASTIQILGAKKAVLRHMIGGAKAPKHGLLFSHPSVNSAPLQERGKKARQLAARISKAAKLDYFK